MKRLNIDYENKRDCFADIKNVRSDLIVGRLDKIPDPWFSYIVPVYKRADLLRETLASILEQKPVDFAWDIVVVDNEAGGENETERLIRELNNDRILYYRNRENVGPDGNYNRCIELARGEWLAMLHGDDLIINDHLQRMGTYIKEKEKGFKSLAYISPGYQDFRDAKQIHLNREDVSEPIKIYKGKLKRFRAIDVAITGYSVGLPSFGTVMNKKIMMDEGGFDEKLGICEDVITPYRLMKKYRVYVTPCVMGYHRFEGNESIKTRTIYRICEAMCDFREYIFSQNILAQMWGKIARPIFFDILTEYCSYMSGFSENRLKKSDFAYIYPEKKSITKFAWGIFNTVENIYCFITGAVTFEQRIKAGVSEIIDEVLAGDSDKMLVIYGAGRAGKNAQKVLRQKYGIITNYFAVTNKDAHEHQVNNVPVKCIDELETMANESLVILATLVPEFYYEMKEKLDEKGFNNVIALDKRFRSE